MLNENDPIVSFKLDILRRGFPAKSAVVFGDVYGVDGGFSAKCVEYGCTEVLLVDTLETAAWQQTRMETPGLDFYKGDFSNALFMRSFNSKFELGVCFDILLHQAPLLHTINLILEKVDGTICIAQPMLRERADPNTLIFLPCLPTNSFYPLANVSEDYRVFDPLEVNHSHWIWGMTPSFLRSALQGEGFSIHFETELPTEHLTPPWMFWGCVARRESVNPRHWSRIKPERGLHVARW